MTEPNLTTVLNDAKDKREADRRKTIGKEGTRRNDPFQYLRTATSDRRQHAKEHYTQMARIAALEDYLRQVAGHCKNWNPHLEEAILNFLADEK